MARITNIYFYKHHESMKDFFCFYCGCYGESKDHVPPICYQFEIGNEQRILVRACILCNTLLGTRAFFTLLQRCDYLLSRYGKKYIRVLSIPAWTQEEIEELSGKLRRSVILGIKKKKFIEEKLIFLKKNIDKLQGYNS